MYAQVATRCTPSAVIWALRIDHVLPGGCRGTTGAVRRRLVGDGRAGSGDAQCVDALACAAASRQSRGCGPRYARRLRRIAVESLRSALRRLPRGRGVPPPCGDLPRNTRTPRHPLPEPCGEEVVQRPEYQGDVPAPSDAFDQPDKESRPTEQNESRQQDREHPVRNR